MPQAIPFDSLFLSNASPVFHGRIREQRVLTLLDQKIEKRLLSQLSEETFEAQSTFIQTLKEQAFQELRDLGTKEKVNIYEKFYPEIRAKCERKFREHIEEHVRQNLLTSLWLFKIIVLKKLEKARFQALMPTLIEEKDTYIQTYLTADTPHAREEKDALEKDALEQVIQSINQEIIELEQMRNGQESLEKAFTRIDQHFQLIANQAIFYPKAITPDGYVRSSKSISTSITQIKECVLTIYRTRTGKNEPFDSFDILEQDWFSALEKNKSFSEPLVMLFFKIGLHFRSALTAPDNEKKIGLFQKACQTELNNCVAYYQKRDWTIAHTLQQGVLALIGVLVGLLTSPALCVQSHRNWIKNTFFSTVETETARSLKNHGKQLSDNLSEQLNSTIFKNKPDY